MFTALIEKCNEKNIKFEQKVPDSIIVEIPEARSFRPIKISHRLLGMLNNESIDIFDFKFIPGYNAIWSESKGVIECEIDYRSSFRHFRKFYLHDNVDEVNFKVGDYEVTVSNASIEFSFLTVADINNPSFFVDERKIKQAQEHNTTVKLKTDNLKTTDQANKLVETVIESFCFEVSCKLNEVFTPAMPRKFRRSGYSYNQNIYELNVNKKIDKNALAYYWNAEAAHKFPLIQYLGYYQVVECFYSYFSDRELHNNIGIILKDTNFNLHNYKHINKIVEENRKFFNNNKDQAKLELTIKSSMLESDFKEWYEYKNDENDKLNRKAYFSGKKCTNVSEKKIDSTSCSELLKQALDRFYDIRCRIVHTDSNLSGKDLNPRMHYENFKFDIELAKFFAQKVLLATSTDF